jgi:hypothetical protein
MPISTVTGTSTSTSSGVNTSTALVSSTQIPYMRSIVIRVYGSGFKPKTQLFCFFDDLYVGQLVRPVTSVAVPPLNYRPNSTFTASPIDTRNYVTRTFSATELATTFPEATLLSQGWVKSEMFADGSAKFINGNGQTIPQYPFVINGTTNSGTAIVPGTPVSGTTSQETGAFGDAIITNDNGEFLLDFIVPSSTFRIGQRKFQVTDTTDLTVGSLTGGSAIFTAKGTLNTYQTTYAYWTITTNTTYVTNDFYGKWHEPPVTPPPPPPQPYICWSDPVAQSFFLEGDAFAGGGFLTSVDLYFAKRDATVPVRLEIRNIVNGYPGSNVYSTVVKNAKDILTSNDSSVATNFRLDEPIFLEENGQYCFVVRTMSKRYQIWASELGEKAVDSNKIIAEQPNLGSLFKSQNNATWTAEQKEDLKFKLNFAKFDISQNRTVRFNNVIGRQFHSNTSVFSASMVNATTVRIDMVMENHGFGNNGSTGKLPITVNPEFVDSRTGITGYMLTGTFDVISVINEASNVDDVLSFNITYSMPSSIGSATVRLDSSGEVWADGNTLMDLAVFDIGSVKLGGTTIQSSARFASGQSPCSTIQVPYLKDALPTSFDNLNYITFKQSMLIANKSNELAKMDGDSSVDVDVILSSFNENVSPWVKNEMATLSATGHRINRVNPSAYLTDKVTLVAPATGLRCFLGASKPQGSELLLFYRVSDVSEESHESKPWIQTYATADATSSTPADFKEFVYDIATDSPFTVFDFKIVMRGEADIGNSAMYPILKDFRAVAMA